MPSTTRPQPRKLRQAGSAAHADQDRQAKVDPAQNLRDDEFIKKHLVQINIEGFHALWCDDIPGYFTNIYTTAKALKSMREDEIPSSRRPRKSRPPSCRTTLKKKIPEKAWVVEIRGYTYHKDGESFVINTLIENLRRPEMVNPDIFPHAFARRPGRRRKAARRKCSRNRFATRSASCSFYKNEVVDNPEPGVFVHIKGSQLAQLVKPPIPLVPVNADAAGRPASRDRLRGRCRQWAPRIAR